MWRQDVEPLTPTRLPSKWWWGWFRVLGIVGLLLAVPCFFGFNAGIIAGIILLLLWTVALCASHYQNRNLVQCFVATAVVTLVLVLIMSVFESILLHGLVTCYQCTLSGHDLDARCEEAARLHDKSCYIECEHFPSDVCTKGGQHRVAAATFFLWISTVLCGVAVVTSTIACWREQQEQYGSAVPIRTAERNEVYPAYQATEGSMPDAPPPPFNPNGESTEGDDSHQRASFQISA